MKKSIFLFIVTVFVSNLNAQITLENTFSDNFYYSTNTHLKTLYYSAYPVNGNQFIFYNEDYSYYKTVTIMPPSGYNCNGIANISDHLFNSDDLIEFTCVFFDTLNNSGYLLKLYNENETEIQDFGTAYAGYAYKTVNNEVRFSTYKYTNYPNPDYETDVYSLPGSIASTKSIKSGISEYLPYPNPANTIIYLKYNLDQSEIENLQIFNSSGQIIETKKIGGAFDKIKLDISSYPSGQYFYKYKTNTQKFIVE